MLPAPIGSLLYYKNKNILIYLVSFDENKYQVYEYSIY